MILWAWGVVAAALAITDFMTRSVQSAPLLHLFELSFVLIILVALTGLTWHWLGGKESIEAESGNSKQPTGE
jgi:hypothetical protein